MESQVDPSDSPAISSEDYPYISDITDNMDKFMGKFMSLRELSRARVEPIAIIGIKDLQLEALVGADGWGRDGDTESCPAQPILVSMSLSLQQPFKTASEKDDITEDTIHYGRLRSAIIEAVNDYNSPKLNNICERCLPALAMHLLFWCEREVQLATGKHINWSSFKIMLPRSSLLGAGISSTTETLYQRPSSLDKFGVLGRSITLRLHDLTVPTIIGMLAKERIRKQNVVANVEIDFWRWSSDLHWDTEQIIVKMIEESTFQTLEALAEHVGKRIIRHILIPKIVEYVRSKMLNPLKWDAFSDDYTKVPWKKTTAMTVWPVVKIKLEKPGIYINTIPGVELTMDTQPLPNSPYFALWKGYKKLATPKRPFEGTLMDWIAKNDPEDLEIGESPLVDLDQQIEAFQVSLAESRRFTNEVTSRPSSFKCIPEGLLDEGSGLVDLQRKMDTFKANLAETKTITDEIKPLPSSSHSNCSSQVVEKGA